VRQQLVDGIELKFELERRGGHEHVSAGLVEHKWRGGQR
jgi:hypothetical protein